MTAAWVLWHHAKNPAGGGVSELVDGHPGITGEMVAALVAWRDGVLGTGDER